MDKIFVQKGCADSILRELISICVLNEKRGKKRRDVNIAGVAPVEKSGPCQKGGKNRYIGRFRRYSGLCRQAVRVGDMDTLENAQISASRLFCKIINLAHRPNSKTYSGS
jgi:hypothetical protein